MSQDTDRAVRFDGAAASALENAYRGPDVVAQRAATLRHLALQPGERVLDIGSGPGFLCEEMAPIVGPTGTIRGIDLSRDLVARASERNPFAWLSYGLGDATALPEPDQHYDVVVSTQVAEFVSDLAAFCAEAFRVLKPAGRGLVLATDWEAIAWHSDHPERMRRVLEAYLPHSPHSCLPRYLEPQLKAAGFAVADVRTHPILNRGDDPHSYSRGLIKGIEAYVSKRSDLHEVEITAWRDELEGLAAQDRYYFLSNRILFLVERPA